jgi:hypothetical protein
MPKPLNRDITAGLALVVLFMVFPERWLTGEIVLVSGGLH